jgi:signal transduction histidine kinase
MAVFESPRRRVIAAYVAAGLVATAVVMAVAVFASLRAGTNEAINDAKDRTIQLAGAGIVEVPRAVIDNQTPGAAALNEPAMKALNDKVQNAILKKADDIVRVKIWKADGTIVYSDMPDLIRMKFPLSDDELAVLNNSDGAEADASDPTKPENRFEQDFGRMLQVYVPLSSEAGNKPPEKLLFEVYYTDDSVAAASRRIWAEFAPILLGGLVLLAAVNLPLAWRLATRAQRDQEEKAELLQAAVDASEMERHRIAGDLHDGVVQDLTGITFSLAAVAGTLEQQGSTLAPTVTDAADHTRSAVSALRSLLIEIYPPNLRDAGLPNALEGLLASVRSRGITATVEVDPDLRCSTETEALLFRCAQEALRNVVSHADASTVVVRLNRADSRVVLTVTDDGAGLRDVSWRTPATGHAGLRLLADLVQRSGGQLDLVPGDPHGAVFSVTVPSEVAG